MRSIFAGGLTSDRIFGFFRAQLARVSEGGEGFADARHGVLIGRDVEVLDRVIDELRWPRPVSFIVLSLLRGGGVARLSYGSGIL